MLDKLKDFQIAILGLLLAFGVIVATSNVTKTISKDNITVTGSAYEIIKSDSASWVLNLESRGATRAVAYKTIKNQIPVVKKFLIDNGIDEKNITINVPTNYTYYKSASNGGSTNEIEGYNYTQSIKVTSNDVELMKNVALKAQDLVEQGINLTNYNEVEYQYSNLADLKVKLLEKATKDARERAKSMLKSNRNKIGKIKSAKMGVFQITPVESTNVSDYGINDTSTIDKKVTAVVSVVFAIK